MKKMLSFILCIIMVCSSLPTGAMRQKNASNTLVQRQQINMDKPQKITKETKNLEQIKNQLFNEQKMLSDTIKAQDSSVAEMQPISVTDDVYGTNNEIKTNVLINNIVSMSAVATDFVFDENTGTITKYTGSGGDVVIPEQINGVAVKSIGKEAFNNCSSIIKLILPAGLISIDSRAFQNCHNLAEISIPNSVTSIGDYAFADCWSLTGISIPEGIIGIGNGVFSSCYKMINATIPDSITTIGNYAFEECVNLSEINLPSSLNSIGNYAFESCNKLESITISEAVTHIGDGAFESCIGLKNVIMPEVLTYLGSHAFDYCTSLSNVTIPGTVASIGDYSFYACKNLASINIKNGITSIGKYAFSYCEKLTEITIPGSVAVIGDYAFLKCIQLTKVSASSGLKTIGNSAFSSCSNLIGITLPDSVTSIGHGAFYNCRSLTEIKLPEGLTEIQYETFSYCRNLNRIDMPGTLKSIGYSAFNSCSSLANIEIPNGVTSIENRAFNGCSGLTGIILPNGMTSIESNLFIGCSKLAGINIPNSITNIGEYAFRDCTSLSGITLPDSIVSIGDGAFNGCSILTDIVIPNNVTSLGNDTFNGCVSLMGIKLPDGLTNIGTNMFKDCRKLISVSIPGSVTSIGDNAFFGCSGLNSIIIPNNVTSLGNGIFSWCGSLTGITIPDSVTNIGNNAFYCCDNLSRIIMPRSITSIGDYMFFCCSSLSEILVPESVTGIGCKAFSSCTNLVSLSIPGSVTSIGDGAFSYCINLASVNIPDSVISIGNDVFYNCSSLTGIDLPNSIKSIGNEAFSSCTNLKNIVIPDSVTNMGDSVFSNCTSLARVSIPDSVTNIGNYLFYNCSSLSNIIIPDSVTDIGEYSFAGCTSLSQIIIPDGVVNIGFAAFAGCFNLSDITILDNVTNIGEDAFFNCPKVTIHTFAGSYAEGYANRYSISLSYINSQSASIKITIPSSNTPGKYSKMVLTVINKNNNSNMSVNTTDNTTYSFGGLTPGETYKVILTNKFGDIIGEIDNIAVASGINSVSFDSLREIKTVSITVMDNQGNDVTVHSTVKWFNVNDNYISQGQSISELIPGTKLFYTIELDSTLSAKYVTPTRQSYTVTDMENNIQFSLIPIPTITLRGKITDSATGNTLQGAVVSISQLLNGKSPKNTIITTDSNGLFTAQIYNDITNIAIIENNYITRILTNIQSGFNGDYFDLGEIKLSEIVGAQVKLDMTYTFSTITGKTPLKINSYYDSANLQFELFNKTQGKQLSNFLVQYPYIVLPKDANPGDEISIIATSKDNNFKAEQTIITLNSDLTATAYFDFIQHGSLKATYSSSGNIENKAIIYNDNGKYIKCLDFNQTAATSNALPEGNYNVVFMGKSFFLNTIQNLSYLSEVGLVENIDYVKQQFRIQRGIITEIGDIVIPSLDESKLFYTENAKTSFTTNKTQAVLSSYFNLRNQYSFKDTYKNQVTNISAVYVFPDNCELLQNSVLVGGFASSKYDYNNNTLTVPLSGASDIVRFCAIPTAIGIYSINAFLQFDIGGTTLKQPIGAVRIEATGLTINIPEKTARKSVEINGISSPNSDITIYDNNVVVGKTKALLNGSWKLDIELYKPYTYSFHNIHAEAQTRDGVNIVSGAKLLTFDLNFTEVSRVTMINTAHTATSLELCEYVTVFDFLQPSEKTQMYWYWPSYPEFTFKVEFTKNDPSLLSNVNVNIFTTSGNVITLPAVYDSANKIWVAAGNFDSHSLPSNVSVNYELASTNSIVDLTGGSECIKAAGGEEFLEISDAVKGQFTADNSITFDIVDKSDGSSKFKYAMNTIELSDDEVDNLKDDTSYAKEVSVDGGVLYSKWIVDNMQSIMVLVDLLEKKKYEFSFDADTSTTESYDIHMLNSSGSFAANGSGNDVSGAMKNLETTFKVYKEYFDNSITKNQKLKYLFDKYDTFKRSDENATKVIDYGLDAVVFVPQEEIRLCNEIKSSPGLTQEQKNQLYAEVAAWGAFAPSVNLAENWIKDIVSLEAVLKKLKLEKEFESPTLQAAYKHQVDTFNNILFGWLHSQIEKFFEGYRNIPSDILYKKSIMEYKNGYNGNINYIPQVPYTKSVNPLLDPSGYVYEAVPSNRIDGVTATVFYKQNLDDTTATFWAAEEYQQENPLITDANGAYAWDVPIGWWQVKYEKEGYQTTYSEWLPVPPPQVDINIGMVSFTQPGIVRVNGYEDYIELVFDKYMELSTLTTGNIKIKKNNMDLMGRIGFVDEEANPQNPEEKFVKKVHFIPYDGWFNSDDIIEITVSRNVKSYAQVNMAADYIADVSIEVEPKSLTVTENLDIDFGGNGIINIAVVPGESAKGKKIIAVSSSPTIATVSNEAIIDDKGNAVIQVNGKTAGEAYITLNLEGTDLWSQSKINVSMPSEQLYKAAAPVSSVPAGIIPANTQVQLSTITPGATIYYTIDGTSPCSSATRNQYTGPITITHSVKISAAAVSTGLAYSDVVSFVYIIPDSLIGDCNEDGKVDIDDLTILSLAYGAIPGNEKWDERADLNGDKVVDYKDFGLLKQQYTK